MAEGHGPATRGVIQVTLATRRTWDLPGPAWALAFRATRRPTATIVQSPIRAMQRMRRNCPDDGQQAFSPLGDQAEPHGFDGGHSGADRATSDWLPRIRAGPAAFLRARGLQKAKKTKRSVLKRARNCVPAPTRCGSDAPSARGLKKSNRAAIIQRDLQRSAPLRVLSQGYKPHRSGYKGSKR